MSNGGPIHTSESVGIPRRFDAHFRDSPFVGVGIPRSLGRERGQHLPAQSGQRQRLPRSERVCPDQRGCAQGSDHQSGKAGRLLRLPNLGVTHDNGAFTR